MELRAAPEIVVRLPADIRSAGVKRNTMIKNIGSICKKKRGDYEYIKKLNGAAQVRRLLTAIVGLDDLTIEYVQGILEQGVLLPA